jgi:DNA repair protein RecN (Recombination protein N)
MLAANPGGGARARPCRVGGELSRVMLALHVVLDAAGIAARWSSMRSMRAFPVPSPWPSARPSRDWPGAIRCCASLTCRKSPPTRNGHYHVHKRVEGGRTHTGIEALAGEARVEALARMLGGRQATTASRENAAELLAEAGQASRPRGGR